MWNKKYLEAFRDSKKSLFLSVVCLFSAFAGVSSAFAWTTDPLAPEGLRSLPEIYTTLATWQNSEKNVSSLVRYFVHQSDLDVREAHAARGVKPISLSEALPLIRPYFRDYFRTLRLSSVKDFNRVWDAIAFIKIAKINDPLVIHVLSEWANVGIKWAPTNKYANGRRNDPSVSMHVEEMFTAEKVETRIRALDALKLTTTDQTKTLNVFLRAIDDPNDAIHAQGVAGLSIWQMNNNDLGDLNDTTRLQITNSLSASRVTPADAWDCTIILKALGRETPSLNYTEGIAAD